MLQVLPADRMYPQKGKQYPETGFENASAIEKEPLERQFETKRSERYLPQLRSCYSSTRSCCLLFSSRKKDSISSTTCLGRNRALRRYPSAPILNASRTIDSCPRLVSKKTGVLSVLEPFSRRSLRIASPFFFGNIMSRRIRSNDFDRASSNP